MSSSELEGAENTDDEFSSTDLDSSDDFNDDSQNEEFPLQQDVHQQNLIAIHITEKRKKGEGEVHGLRYMIVSDDEIDDDDDDDAPKHDDKLKINYKINTKHKMVMFALPNTYTVSDTMMMVSYLTAGIFILSLIITLPILQQIYTPLNLILAVFAVIFFVIGIFLDGKFYLNFNYGTKQIYIQQRMCVGNCICGNKGAQGKLIGDFESFANAQKVKINDVIGENKWKRWQFILTLKDHENGENDNVLFTTSDEEMIDNFERNVNEWWKKYNRDGVHK